MPQCGILFALEIDVLKNAGRQMQNLKSPIGYDLGINVAQAFREAFGQRTFG